MRRRKRRNSSASILRTVPRPRRGLKARMWSRSGRRVSGFSSRTAWRGGQKSMSEPRPVHAHWRRRGPRPPRACGQPHSRGRGRRVSLPRAGNRRLDALRIQPSSPIGYTPRVRERKYSSNSHPRLVLILKTQTCMGAVAAPFTEWPKGRDGQCHDARRDTGTPACAWSFYI